MDKIKVLKIILYLGAAYAFFGAIAQIMGFQYFSFYFVEIYSPYHDTLVSLCALIFSMLFFIVAINPVKNIDTLNILITGLVLVTVFSFVIIKKVDFLSIGTTALLIYLRPRDAKAAKQKH